VHNIVAYDLVTSAARLPAASTPELDRTNLVRRAREDLDLVSWPDRAERAEQYAIVEPRKRGLGVEPGPAAREAEGGVRATVAAMLEHTPRLERLVYRANRADKAHVSDLRLTGRRRKRRRRPLLLVPALQTPSDKPESSPI